MAATRRPANKVRITIPPRVEAHVFEIDFNRIQEEIEEQLIDMIDCWGEDFKLDHSEFTLSASYCIKEVTK